MIDLHTHTTYSDGASSLELLLKEAEEAKVTTLSITDHDTIDAYKELKEKKYDIYTGKIIPGGEFNAMFNNAKIELLGYNFDIDKIDKWCKESYNNNSEYMDLDKEFELMISTCHKNRIKIDDDITYDKSMGWPMDVIHPAIKKHEENKKLFTDKEWNDRDYFFRCCSCITDFPLYIDLSNQMPDAKEVSNAIRNAGGKVFLAHLFLYPLRDHIAYLDKLRQENIIDGIEVYHSKYTEEESKILIEYAKKYNSFMSGGSDYHGDKKPGRKVGTGYNNLNISEKIVKKWCNNK